MNNVKNIIIVGVLTLGIGYAYGRYMQPAKIETQEKQVVVKETEVVYREIKQADGTVIKETITKDTAKKETDKSNKTTAQKSKYLLSGIVSYSISEKKESFGGAAQMRLGDTPFFGGVVYKDNSIGAVVTLEL